MNSKNELVAHGLTQSYAGGVIPFVNNFGLSGCMASVICFGSFLPFRSKDDIIDVFLKLVKKDAKFKNSIFKSNGMCCLVHNNDYLISRMVCELLITPVQYLKILKYNVIKLRSLNKGSDHFVMVYDYDKEGNGMIYDPAFPFFLSSLPGFFGYYNLREDKTFSEIRNYPYKPL